MPTPPRKPTPLFEHLFSSNRKADPIPAPTPAPATVQAKKQITRPKPPQLPKANGDGELANELRDPKVLDKLDAEHEEPGTGTNPPARISKPLVIKGSESPPEIPRPKEETPKPPLTKPSIPEE